MDTGEAFGYGERAAIWRKSTRSGPYSDNCVEVAIAVAGVGVRDSTDPTGPVLVFPRGGWRTFIGHVRRGRFDLR